MNEKKFYTQDGIKTVLIGETDTPPENHYESDLNLFLIGEAIRRTRMEKKLSQAALGKMIGANKSFISRIEHGLSVNRETIDKIFEVLEIKGGWKLRSRFPGM